MSVLYTTCSGQSSTSASRRGSKNSGVRASIQSYKGSVICSMNYSEDEKMPIVRIGTSDYSCCYSDTHSYDFVGTINEFKDLLKLASDIKDGKVSVVKHRKKIVG